MVEEERSQLLRRLRLLELESAKFRQELQRIKEEMLRLEAEPEPGAPAAQPEPRRAPAAERHPIIRWAERRREVVDLEFWLGGRGLLLLGVLALVFAVTFFLKYSIERGWIGPAVRALLGAAVGASAVVLGERIRAAGHRIYGLWLAAGGFSAVYLSVWAAAALYSVVSSPVGFTMMVAVVAAAAGLGLLRGSQSFVALAAFGGYLAPLLLQVEPASDLFGLGYLGILTGAGLWVSHRAGWPYLAGLAAAGGSLMVIAGAGDPHLHGLYLVALMAGALLVARRRGWPVVSFLAVAAGWIALAAGSGDWGISGLKLVSYAGALWLASLVAWVGVADWVGPDARARLDSGDMAEARAEQLAELSGAAVTLVPPALFFLFAMIGLADSPYRESRDTIGLLLALALGAAYIGLAAYGPAGRGAGRRAWRSGLGYAFWVLAPTMLWSEIALVRAWLLEGVALTAAGAALKRVEARTAGLAALALSLLAYLGAVSGRAAGDLAFVSGWALSGLGVVAGLAIWSLALDRTEGPKRWELELRPIVLLVAAVLFLSWGTGEIRQFFELLGGGPARELARDLSVSGFWMAYAAALLAAGLSLGRAPVRWAGLVMALIVAGKVFLYDLSNLAQLYRIVSFVMLAIVLLALSFGYQKLRSGEGAGSEGSETRRG